MKKILFAIFVLTSMSTFSQNSSKKEQFIRNLMQKMTLDEKIGQLNLLTGGEATTGSAVSTGVEEKIKAGNVGGIFSLSSPAKIRKTQEIAMKNSRLKIPIIFGMDVIHGYKTVFPIPLALSCTWDMDLIEKSARTAAQEATADGICWTFSPMVDISRDPRWGRISEGSGEDVYLGSQIAKAMVRGYQGKDLSQNNTMAACVKHYALYGAAEAGRDYNTTDMSRIKMYNEYLPPYKAAIDAGAVSIMASFNEIDGIPATANRWLLTDVLRKEWGFRGLVVTDYTGINEMIDHGLGDLQAVSSKALHAGIDMDMVGEGFLTTLKKSLAEKKVTLQEIDRACYKTLELKYDLGLFEDPYKYCDENRAKTEILTPATRLTARNAAAKSFVLLKNDNNVLPLAKKGTIALIGPLADNKENMGGTWSISGDLTQNITVLEGIKNAVGANATIVTARGSNIFSDAKLDEDAAIFGKSTHRDIRTDADMIDEALKVAEKSDVIVTALGESAEMSGESSSRSDITIPENQINLLKALLKTGKPVILLLFTGRPLALTWENENVPVILNTWFGGTETGNAIADVLFGITNPAGKLTTSFPRNVGQIPIYYNYKNTGRPVALDAKGFQKFRSNYMDVPNSPLYPFGYGLSYTKFTYGDISLSKNKMNASEKIEVNIAVTNTGNYDGEETVQLYIQDLVGSVTRPVKELKGFKKIFLKKGESQNVNFTIGIEELKFYNDDLKYLAESGDFNVFIGTNSRDVKKAGFTLKMNN